MVDVWASIGPSFTEKLLNALLYVSIVISTCEGQNLRSNSSVVRNIIAF